MYNVLLQSFLSEEHGGGTVMGLLWFILLVGICGLAVDSTNGFRHRTMLQATADATALAAAIDLPDPSTVTTTASTYAAQNMDPSKSGYVLDTADVHVGRWDEATDSLDTTDPQPDAVYVRVREVAENINAVPVYFLRIVGLTSWNVEAQAVAQRFIPECLNDGLIARGIVDISSNNGFYNNICIHGQEGVHMQNHNYHELGVNVSMMDLDDLTIPSGGMESNPGLPEALRENGLDPRMVNHVHELMDQMLDPTSEIVPSFIDTALPVIEVDDKFTFTTANHEPGRIYEVLCTPNKQVQIQNNSVISDAVIIAECNISVGSGVSLADVVLGSRAIGNGQNPLANANINFSANVDLGAVDNCADGGGSQLFSAASIHFSSSMRINGSQMVAAGDIDLGARDEGINGISAQAGGDITLTSNNAFGLCNGDAPNLFTVPYYRLVH